MMLGSNLRNFIDQNEQEMKQTIRNYINESMNLTVKWYEFKAWRFDYKICQKFLLQMYLLHELLTILVTKLLVMRNIKFLVTNLLVTRNVNISCDKFICHDKCQLFLLHFYLAWEIWIFLVMFFYLFIYIAINLDKYKPW